MGEKSITLSTGEELPYGFCVWAAGVGPTPLVTGLIEAVPEQRERLNVTRGRVATDGCVHVCAVSVSVCLLLIFRLYFPCILIACDIIYFDFMM